LEKGLCGALRADELSRLGAASWHRRFRPGQVIHAEGEIPPSFCAVISGVVKLMKSLPNGSQQIVGLAGPGDFLGRPFGGEAPVSVVAASEVNLCWFPRATIEGLATESNAMKRWLFEYVSDELEKAQEWIMLLGRMTAEQKIAAFLLSVAHEARSQKSKDGDDPADIPVELPLSRTEIADYLGLTLETVSRQVARLRERGVITAGAGRSIVLHHPEVLQATVESAQPSARAKEAMRL